MGDYTLSTELARQILGRNDAFLVENPSDQTDYSAQLAMGVLGRDWYFTLC